MISFRTDEKQLQSRWNNAIAGLGANIRSVQGHRVLIEGGSYGGVWLECAPMEGLLYADVDISIAIENHRIFFDHQRSDGQLPCYVWPNQVGWSQIQMVVPIAATAWELYHRTRDLEFLTYTYKACAAWDAWLARYRDTRGSGLCEAFCEYDTGHDNSTRWHGLPRKCPEDEARNLAPVSGLPYLAPDLSATVYGGRVALAEMAAALKLPAESQRWKEAAQRTRKAFFQHCWDADDRCCFDVDKNGNFVRMRTDTLSRVLSEHLIVPDAFAEIEARHLRNPQRFGTPYPFPSIAVDDPAFDHSMRKNSWGGPSQALTALRASRWLEHYRRPGLLMHLLSRWRDALVAADIFGQQINPWTGEFTATTGEYSPSMLLLIEAVARLHGIHRHDGGLAFNCRLPPVATSVECSLSTDKGIAHLKNNDGHTEIVLDGRGVCIVDGVCRLETSLDGRPLRIVGTDPNSTSVGVRIQHARHECALLENQVIAIETLTH